MRLIQLSVNLVVFFLAIPFAFVSWIVGLRSLRHQDDEQDYLLEDRRKDSDA
jgi:hypothetical protein